MKRKSKRPFSSITAYQWIVFSICWLGGVFAGMDANLFSVMLHSSIADIAGSPDQTEVITLGSYVLSSFLLGWMAGGIVMGIASDSLGRVKTLAISIIFYTCSTALTGSAHSVSALAFFRFLTGLGVGGTMLGISIFLAETWNSSSRAVALSALITSYQVGVMISGFVSQLFPDWRMAFGAGGIPVLLAFAVVRYFRETAAWEKKDAAPVQSTEPSGKSHLLIGGVIFGSLLLGYWASQAWVPTWIQGLLGEQSLGHEKNVATMIHGFCAIAGCIFAGPLADAYGRRPVIAISYAGAFAVSLTLFLGHSSYSSSIYAFYGLLGVFIGSAQAVMYLYLPELFSTRVRATSVGICLNGGRLVTAVAILFLGVLIKWFGGYVETLSLFSGIYLIGVGMLIFAPETKSKELPG